MSDLIERCDAPSRVDWLRYFLGKVGLGACICEGQEISAAADEIERLTAERDELRRQLAEADKSIAHLQDALRVAVNAATRVNDV